MLITYRFRIKDSKHLKILKEKANAVNFVWNYCNEISQRSAKKGKKWISEYVLHNLTSGSSKELNLHSKTIKCTASQFINSRNKVKKPKLRWRSKKSILLLFSF